MTTDYGRVLHGLDEQQAKLRFAEAAGAARGATCLRAKCGTIITAQGLTIGSGSNGPPRNLRSRATCTCDTYISADKPMYDRTCCIHAEWRAILDAAKHYPNALEGSRLYFMRIDNEGNMTFAGDPYCTVCSRLALEVGVAEIALWQKRGIVIMNSIEYDTLSYEYYSPIRA